MCCSDVVGHHQAVAGMLAGFFLVFGIFVGVVFATPTTLIIQHLGSGRIASNVTHH